MPLLAARLARTRVALNRAGIRTGLEIEPSASEEDPRPGGRRLTVTQRSLLATAMGAELDLLEAVRRSHEATLPPVGGRTAADVLGSWRTLADVVEAAETLASSEEAPEETRERAAGVAGRAVAARDAAFAALGARFREDGGDASAWAECAGLFSDECLEAVGAVEDLPPERALVRLEAGVEAAGRLLRAAPVAGERRLRPARRGAARLRRARRLLRDQAAERRLSLRLARLFGAGNVARWDQLILAMIVAVVVLVFVEAVAPGARPAVDAAGAPDRRPPSILEWIDFAVCCIFLVDFGVRVALTPRRLRYVLRHAVVDLLPSIPWGILVHVPDLDVFRAVRLLRFFRLRLPRLVLFLVRGLDRLVQAGRGVLNRNIVFTTEAPWGGAHPELPSEAAALKILVDRRAAAAERRLSRADRIRVADARLRRLRADFGALAARPASAPSRRAPLAAEARDVSAAAVIEALGELDSAHVAETVGWRFAARLNRVLRVFRLPGLRRLPVLRFIFGPEGEPDPLVTTARTGRVLGSLLAGVEAVVHWFADFHGVVTGPQFLDRVGATLMKATARPAQRLLMFGLVFLVLSSIVHILGFEALDGLRLLLGRILGVPMVVLGGICLIPLLTGIWFRRISGEAADFYDRLAEGQFFSLLEGLKERFVERDLGFLVRRVVGPEEGVSGLERQDVEASARSLRDHLTRAMLGRRASGGDGVAAVDWELRDRVLLHYRDWMDGPCLHYADNKVATQLLGNLTLETVRRRRLRQGRRDLRRAARLDPSRGRGGLRGPHLWFNLITESLTQKVARLVLEYNTHAVPVASRGALEPPAAEAHRTWVTRRLALAERRRSGVIGPGGPEDGDSCRRMGSALTTTAFTALHFLTAEPDRDETVGRAFGPETARLLALDRENLIRGVFGTWPLDRLPKSRRSFNAYLAWQRHVAGGRIFLLPLRGLLLAAWLMLIFMRRIGTVIRDVRRPDQAVAATVSARAGFGVAVRKILRMRRPVYMEALRMRALFDPEYLGLRLPHLDAPSPAVAALEEDLAMAQPVEPEREEFRRLRNQRAAALQRFAAWLDRIRAEAPAAQTGAEDQAGPSHVELRAMAVAWVIDQDGMDSLASAWERLGAMREEASGAAPASGRRTTRLREEDRTACDEVREALGGRGDPEEVREAFRRAVAAAGGDALADVRRVSMAFQAGGSVENRIRRGLRKAAAEAPELAREIVTLRTVQSLAVLDLRGYFELVRELGCYDAGASGVTPPGGP